jgi:branched-chain amino acid transport system substrate-binding protein
MMCSLVAACGGGADTVTIGAAGPWHEGFGAMNKRGIDLAAEEINASRMFGDRKFEVVERNDSGDGARAAALAAQFVADPRITAVVGHVTSGAMVAAARVYDGFLPAVATTATSPALTGISRWTFRVISSDSMNGAAIARFASGALGRHRAGILYENDAYGRGLTNAFRKAFTGEIVSIDPISASFPNFEPYITYLKRHGADLVFVAGTEGSGMKILREGRRQGLAADFVGGDGWTGIVSDTAAAEGAYVGAPFTAEDPRPEAQKFVEAFRKKYGMVPDGNAALAYDATMLVARAIRAAGTNRRKVRDWLAGLGSADAFAGVSGRIHFGADGDPQGRAIVMTRVHAGRLLVQGAGNAR